MNVLDCSFAEFMFVFPMFRILLENIVIVMNVINPIIRLIVANPNLLNPLVLYIVDTFLVFNIVEDFF